MTTPKPPSNLAIRVATALVATPIILALLFKAPPLGFYCLVLPASLVGSWELFAMTHPDDKPSQAMGVILAAAASLAVYFGLAHDRRIVLTALFVVPLLGQLVTLARLGDIKSAALRSFAMGVGPLIVAVPLTLLAVFQRDLKGDGPGFALVTLLFAWFSDTGGYFAGRFLGKHKLYEAVSPKKTVEGAIGGLFGSVLGALLAHFWFLPSLPLVDGIVLAVVSGAVGQAGDLGESLVKRSTGVKDSGQIVPGHGGVLDRIDALLLTSTCVYVYAVWFRGI